MNILYITNLPSPYRVQYFNELAKFCNLKVVFERESASDRDERWKNNKQWLFDYIFLNGHKIKNDLSFSFRIKKYLNKQYDFIVFCNYSSPTEMIGIKYCQKRKIPYCIEADGAFFTKNRFKNRIKRNLLKKAIICFSTCDNSDMYFSKLGVEKNRIFRYRFTSLNKNEILERNNDNYQINNSKKTLLYVGQFIHRKGIDILLRACVDLSNEYRLILVGGKLNDELIKMTKNLKCELIVEPFKTKEELEYYFKIADVFVLPTREDIWGLVVNEALSYGLPTITTSACNAGLELIKDGYNGFVITPNNVPELKKAISEIFKFTLKNNCFESIKDYTIENMVLDHLTALNHYE